MKLPLGFKIVALLGALCIGTPCANPQAFAVVVHQSNPVSNLSLTDLYAIFAGNMTHWPNQAKIVLAHRGPDSAVNQFLMSRLLRTSWQDYKRSLQSLEFMGQEPVLFRVLNSDAVACKFVFNVPSAVAVIGASSVTAPECGDLRVLKIDGRFPTDGGYRLK